MKTFNDIQHETSIHKKVKVWRTLNGLSKATFAEMVGATLTAIQAAESLNRSYPRKTVNKIAELTGLPLSELV